MQKITKSFDENINDSEIESGTYLANFCSWERLKEILEKAENGDKIKGIVAKKEGLTLIFK